MAEVKDGLPSTDFSRMNREYIKAAAKNAAGGGGLPEITESDEGKVLTVENGEAAWAAGGDLPVVPITVTWVDDTGTLSKTWQEIYDIIASGKIAYIIFTNDETATACSFITSCILNEDTYEVNVADISVSPNEVFTYTSPSADGYPTITD